MRGFKLGTPEGDDRMLSTAATGLRVALESLEENPPDLAWAMADIRGALAIVEAVRNAQNR